VYSSELVNSKSLVKNLNLILLKKKALLLLIGSNGASILKIPQLFFLNYVSNNLFSLLFINNYHFSSFVKLFNTLHNRFISYFYFRLVLRGRGYRIKRLCKSLYRFYFIKVNYIYLHVPNAVLVKIKRKRLFFISSNLFILSYLIKEILLIKAVTAYRKRGFWYKRLLLLKKRGKKRI